MGILDNFKQDCANNGIDVMAEIEKQHAMMKEYDEHGTINGKQVEINKSEDYEGIDPECERDASMSDYPDGEIVGDDDLLTLMKQTFDEKYKKYHEEELTIIKSKDYEPVVVKAFCPKCGKEIVNQFPTAFNPYTMDKICRYDCECGWTANLDYAYPRIVMADKNTGEEVEVFAK